MAPRQVRRKNTLRQVRMGCGLGGQGRGVLLCYGYYAEDRCCLVDFLIMHTEKIIIHYQLSRVSSFGASSHNILFIIRVLVSRVRKRRENIWPNEKGCQFTIPPCGSSWILAGYCHVQHELRREVWTEEDLLFLDTRKAKLS